MKLTPTANGTKTVSVADPVQGQITAHSELRENLSSLERWRLNRTTSRDKRKALVSIEAAATEAGRDVMVTAIDHQRSLLKAGLANRTVIAFGAQAQELVARAGVVQERLTDTHYEGFTRQLSRRRSMIQGIESSNSKGEITPEEAQAAIDEIKRLVAEDSDRLANSTSRAKDAVDSLVESATNHVTRLRDQI